MIDAILVDAAAYAGLFVAALAAATILPMQSEAALVALVLAGAQPPWALVMVASVGNVLGSVINWALGRGIERLRHHRWFPASEAALERAQGWYRRYGKWSLLLSWMPLIGDPLTVVAGVLREPLGVFLLLVTVAKVGRYLVLAWLTLALA
ncbi:DedA family protein [Starkeya koreensis]|uniref:DedA family protein n=1 Tax=Ancylobacter koreensis TaxID=266121 RepID=A0ABT0DPA6_9HYPH|nr:YqaA family protein [Ancylobacter koreensis]MCK0209106.1 DedA family protein [Ancylobacter koreensis]